VVKSNNNTKIKAIRFYLLAVGLFVCACALVWRMFDLAVVDRNFLLKQGNVRSLRTIEMPAFRGLITDRNGNPLAISTPVASIWVNPADFKATRQQVRKLSQMLRLSIPELDNRIKDSGSREFVYLRRGLAPSVGKQIKHLKIPGVYEQREFRRYYPEGAVTSHLLGFTNIDDQGQEGIELAYNDWLRGIPGAKRVIKDRLGHIVSALGTIRQPKSGHNLVLSIDRRIQYLAYRVLKNTVTTEKATSGSAIVLDAHTGEVLAVVNQPSYNPNNRHRVHDGRYRNRAFTDVFEPGSVIKAFSVASALDSQKYTPKTIVNTAPGYLMVAGTQVSDEHNNGKITVTQILKRSSNVGVTKLTLSLPPEQLVGMLRRVGFGARTQSGFPGESGGVVVDTDLWRKFVLATLAFGYGISVTPIQLAHSYAVFANNGNLVPVSLLRLNKAPKVKKVLDSKVAHEILLMLEAVVEKNGTGFRAKVPGFRIAGKTGTARLLGPNGYDKDHHVASFVGIAPVSNPRLVVLVVINDPKSGRYYGSVVAAPAFKKIMAGSLRILDISPDQNTNDNA
jgi:cell division protein FtsI (penicillin-binding protein 3)